MDGVIFDSEPIHERIFVEYARSLGFEPVPSEYLHFIGTSSVSQWQFMKERYGLTGTPQELSDAKMNLYKIFINSTTGLKPIPGIHELLDDLRAHGVPFAVASSNTSDIVEATLSAIGLADAFTVRVCGDHVELAKPAPDIFLLAATRLGARPEECIVIEDSTNGVLAAERAGMRCIGFDNPHSPGQDLKRANIRLGTLEGLTVKRLLALLDG